MFRNPQYLCITDDDKLYVSDQNSRIQVFKKESVSKSRKAIIVAGQEREGKTLWDATLMCANYAYRVLLHQGYSADNIYYLSADSENNKSDNDLNNIPDVDDSSNINNLHYAITQWASDSKSLLLYFVDHGDKQILSLAEDIVLHADELDEWLDTY